MTAEKNDVHTQSMILNWDCLFSHTQQNNELIMCRVFVQKKCIIKYS